MRELRIDLGRICSNYLALKSAFGPAKVMAVVKANAYGHGMIEVSNALDEAGVDVLGVADLDEAISLRLAGINAPVMCWLLDQKDDLQSAVEHNIILGISTIQQLESVPREAAIHLKVDTGLAATASCRPNTGCGEGNSGQAAKRSGSFKSFSKYLGGRRFCSASRI